MSAKISSISSIILMLLLANLGFSQIAKPVDKPDVQNNTNINPTYSDTLILATLEPVSISSPRVFASDEEYKRYQLYKHYASIVYPYAAQAIRIFRETEYVTQHMSKRKANKHIRRLQKELKDEFKDPLKKLTKTQGKILVKMIERETETPLYYLIKDLRSGFTASYWDFLGRLYGYKLKDGYTCGEDPILDAVLDDLNISYEFNPSLK